MAVPKTGDGRSHWGGRKYTKRQMAALWIAEGGPPEDAGLMAEVGFSESRGYSEAISPTGCRGLWQICPPPDDAMDPRANARYAIGKWANGSGAHHWANYNPTAARKIAQHRKNPNAFARNVRGPGGIPSPPIPNLPDLPGIPNPLDGIEAVAHAIGELVNTFRDAFDWLTSSETWIAFGKIWFGAVMAMLGARAAIKAAR